MIRILHSVSNMDRAGIETMLMNYYRHIDKSQVQFDFLCNKKKPGAYDEEIKQLGGRIFHTPGLNPFRYPQYLRYMKKLFNDNPEYEIVEAHNGALGFYALFAAKLNNIPVRIFHAHGASITEDWKMPLKMVCKALLPGSINQNYTCGIAAAECYFGKKKVEKGEYVLIPNAIDVPKFIYNPAVRDDMRAKYHIKDRHVIGHVGRFMKQKNHIFLLDVFSEYLKIDEKAYLVLLGDGELMEEIKKRAVDLNISENILFAGNVGNANEWYQMFDCFVLPSVWEGLPVVGVEAQAADLPCVFSDTITKEIGFSDKVQFISTSNKNDWVTGIKKALRNQERVDASSIIEENNYDIRTEALKLQKRYLSLVRK